MELLKAYHTDDVYIIGGKACTGSSCLTDEAQITWIDFAYAADTHFPNLDQDVAWEMVPGGDEQTYFDLYLRISAVQKEIKLYNICYVINNNVLSFKQRNAKILSAYLKSF